MTSTSIYSPSHGERLYVEALEEAGAKTGAKLVLEQRRLWKSEEGEVGVFSLEISQPRRMGKTAGEWKPARTLTFEYGEAGEVGLRTLVDHEKMTSTRFEPPLVMLPATMKVGQTHQANTKLEVLDLERNSRVIDRGEAAVISTLTFDKSESGGVQPETLLLQTSMTFEIGPARVLQERGQRIQPQTGGLVSEIERLRVKVGMITIKRDDKSWKLVP